MSDEATTEETAPAAEQQLYEQRDVCVLGVFIATNVIVGHVVIALIALDIYFTHVNRSIMDEHFLSVDKEVPAEVQTAAERAEAAGYDAETKTYHIPVSEAMKKLAKEGAK